MRGFFLANHFLEGIDKAEDCRCIESIGSHAWHLYKGIVGPEDKGVCIEKEKSLFFHKYGFVKINLGEEWVKKHFFATKIINICDSSAENAKIFCNFVENFGK